MSGWFLIQVKLADPSSSSHIFKFCDGNKYTLTGKVISSENQSAKKTRLVIDTHFLMRENHSEKRVNGRIYLNLYGELDKNFQYNDTITVEASLRKFRNFSNPDGFDYETHMKLNNIWCSASANVKSLFIHPETEAQTLFTEGIRNVQQFRKSYTDLVYGLLESPKTSSILCALVVGQKERIPIEVRDDFSKTGASHIIAISGLHLSIIALVFYVLIYKIFSGSRRLLISGNASKISSFLTLVPLLSYALLSGFSPSTQRAMVMIGMVMLARLFDRESDIVNTLALAGVIILIFDPGALFSISFQLSFSAVSFIIFGVSIINQKEWLDLTTLRGKGFMFVSVSILAALGTFPLIIHYFNLISFSQVLTNIIIIPLVGFIVLPLGILSLLFFLFSAGISAGIIKMAGIILSFSINIIEKLALIPFSWCRSGTLSLSELILIYLFFFAAYLFLKGHKKLSCAVFLPVFLLFIIDSSVWIYQRFYNKEIRICVLDVGQGSSALVTLPYGRQILIDGGGFSAMSSFDTGRHIVAPFLWRQKILSLDSVILTHPQSDHMNGLLFILNNFKVKELIKNKDESDSMAYKSILSSAATRQIPIKTIGPENEFLSFDQTVVQFFLKPMESAHPDTVKSDINDQSIVCKINFHEFSILFPGDISKSREEELSYQYGKQLESSVLVSPHHGSASSSSHFFLENVTPKSVIISCGWKNHYGFPHKTTIDKYFQKQIQVFRTDLNGAIQIRSRGKGYDILTSRGS